MNLNLLAEPTDFTLFLTLPEGTYKHLNADGSVPKVTMKVIGDAPLNFAMSVLTQMHEERSIVTTVARTLFGENAADLVRSDPAKAKEFMGEIHDEFLTFEFLVEDEEEGNTIQITLAAPSGASAVHAFQALTREEALNGALLALAQED